MILSINLQEYHNIRQEFGITRRVSYDKKHIKNVTGCRSCRPLSRRATCFLREADLETAASMRVPW